MREHNKLKHNLSSQSQELQNRENEEKNSSIFNLNSHSEELLTVNIIGFTATKQHDGIIDTWNELSKTSDDKSQH